MDTRRVAVTGLGILSPAGDGAETSWDSLINGKSGVRRIQKMDDIDNYSSRIAGELHGFDPTEHFSKKEIRRMDPFSQYGLVAARMAVEDSGIDAEQVDSRRVGVNVSTGVGGLQVLFEQSQLFSKRGPRRFSPFMIPQMITNIVPGQIAIEFGFKGPNFCVTTACATGTHSLGDAMRIIKSGEADMMLAGGTEAPICELGVGGFCAMRALSTRNDEPERASRPFDKERDGFIIAEGAAVLVLEEMEQAKARGAHVYCELAGFGRTCDASHITAPDESGSGAARAMSLAIEDAQLNCEDVGYINAHGTSTPLNDKGETKAIKLALGQEAADKVMVSSTKSMTGHMLGAAGGMEGAVCALTLDRNVVAPTINYENPDPDCDLDYVPNEARDAELNACLSNSLGFGGHNGSICFKRADA